MDQSSSSESDEDTDTIVEWGYNDWNGWRQEQGMLCRFFLMQKTNAGVVGMFF